MDGIRIQQKKLLPWPAAPAGAEIFRKMDFTSCVCLYFLVYS